MKLVSKNEKKIILVFLSDSKNTISKKKVFSSFERSRVHDRILLQANECGLGFQMKKKCVGLPFASFGRGTHIGFEESNFENCLEANSFPWSLFNCLIGYGMF